MCLRACVCVSVYVHGVHLCGDDPLPVCAGSLVRAYVDD